MKELPKVIAISGFAGSGKDTFANVFVNEYDYVKISMADTVKDVLAPIFGWPRHMLNGDTVESRQWRETPDEFWSAKLGREFTPRKAMQEIGTDVFRKYFHTDIWCLAVEKRIFDLAQGKRVIIPDIRFRNEIMMVRIFDCDYYEVQRGENPEWYELAKIENKYDVDLSFHPGSMGYEYPDIHPSEYKWIGVDENVELVKNDGDILDLHNYIYKTYGRP